MSKPPSGHFANTIGCKNWNTAIVWNYIQSTQESYTGTDIPKSFIINTNHGPLWTHPNGTKHIYEAIISINNNPRLKISNPDLYGQLILFDYWKSLCQAMNSNIQYNKKLVIDNWEFVFARPKQSNQCPVVKHALFRGL